MAGMIDWVESTLLKEIDTTFSSSFALDKKNSNLLLKRLVERIGDESSEPGILWPEDISNLIALQQYAVRVKRFSFEVRY